MVESIVGPEIWSNPVQHVRLKPPERLVPKNHNGQALVSATNWHQDNGVVLPEADDSEVLTVWFPLNEATLENGCLQIMPRSHRQGLQTHCPGGPGGLWIPELFMDMDAALPVPMQPGDVLFLTQHTIHGSLANNSDDVRWSFDLRYNPIGQPTGRDLFPGFVRPQQSQSRKRLARSSGVGKALARHPRPAGARGAYSLQPLECRRGRLCLKLSRRGRIDDTGTALALRLNERPTLAHALKFRKMLRPIMQSGWIKISPIRPYQSMDLRINPNLIK